MTEQRGRKKKKREDRRKSIYRSVLHDGQLLYMSESAYYFWAIFELNGP